MKRFLKNSKGIAATDGLIAILIISLFTGIIATILYNIYISNTSLKRMSRANLYIVDIFEYAEKIDYDNATEENLIQYFNNKYESEGAKAYNSQEENNSSYNVIIDVEKYNETEGNLDKLDLVEEITVTVKYKVGNRNQEITMKKIKQKEKTNIE